MVTFLGRFAWQKEGEVALVKLIARPLSLSGEYRVVFVSPMYAAMPYGTQQ